MSGLKTFIADPTVQAAIVAILSGIILSLIQALMKSANGIEAVDNGATKAAVRDASSINPLANIALHIFSQLAARKQGNPVNILPTDGGDRKGGRP